MCAALYRPGPPLDRFVDCFWHWDGYPAPAAKERALPSGSLDLIINLAEDRIRLFARDEETPLGPYPGILVTGAQAGYVVIGTAPRVSVMGVHFKPAGATPFLGVPAADLESTHAPLEALWGPSAAKLRARLIEASTAVERFGLLEIALRAQLRPYDLHPGVAEALRQFEDPGLRSVAEVNARTGLSPRRLIACFREQIGLTPKAYWRVRRFQAALRHLEAMRDVRGAEVAAEHGYFDQAHFIRDFQDFAGLSPRAYLAQEVVRPNHVPLRGKNIQYAQP
ncbi:MAG TPA: helix-turn-helix domain-containing protein [Polyangiales bacterium]|nr:helix-turn-helix domain-containing protein [Polyangiales bacterium]